VASTPRLDRGEEDSFVQVHTMRWFRQSCQKSDQPRRAPQLGRARRAAPEMLGQPAAIRRCQLIQLIGVDQRAGGITIDGLMRVDSAHILYMTGPCQKVAA
jgi:hypothetical protein